MLDRVGRSPGEALAASDVVQQPGMLGMSLDQLAPAVGHLGVFAGLVEGTKRFPHLIALDGRGQNDPWMPSCPVARDGRRRERWVGERADHHDD